MPWSAPGPPGSPRWWRSPRAGIERPAFEKGDRPGGLWAYGAPLSGAYRSLHLNTSRARTELAGFPMPERVAGLSRSPRAHRRVLRRLRGPRGRARPDPVRARRGAARPAAGRRLGAATLEDGSRRVRRAGGRQRPQLGAAAARPALPGRRFDGAPGARARLPRGRDAGRPPGAGRGDGQLRDGHRGRVVALSPSAPSCRCAAAAGSCPSTCSASRPTRSPRPRWPRLPWRLRQPLTAALLRLAVGRPETYGLPAPTAGFLRDPPDDLRRRALAPHPRGDHAQAGDRGARRATGCASPTATREEVDAIVWCTGYRVTVPVPGPEGVLGRRAGRAALYKRIFHHDHDDLFFIGLVQTTGSAIPVVERQSQLLADHLTGRCALPAAASAGADAERRRRAPRAKRYGEHRRPHLRVEFDGFMRELDRELEQRRRRAEERRSARVKGAGTTESGVSAAPGSGHRRGRRVRHRGERGAARARGGRWSGLDLAGDDDARIVACDITDPEPPRPAVPQAVGAARRARRAGQQRRHRRPGVGRAPPDERGSTDDRGQPVRRLERDRRGDRRAGGQSRAGGVRGLADGVPRAAARAPPTPCPSAA